MPLVEFPLRQWLPDQPDLNNQGVVEAKNVFKTQGGYVPVRDIEFPGGNLSYDLGVTDATVSEAMSGGGGGINFYGAVTTNVFDVILRSIDLPGTLSTLNLGIVNNTGSLVNYGEDMYFVSSGNQYKSVSGAAFSLVASDAPIFVTTAARINNFIMTGGGSSIQWSGFNLPEEWAASQRTQAGSADVNKPELGDVTQVIGGRNPMLFQERGCSSLRYVGSPRIWDTREVSNVFGAVPRSAIEVAGVVYFLTSHGDSGANLGHVSGPLSVGKTNGGSVAIVSSGKIDDWLEGNFNDPISRYGMPAVLDAKNKQVVWSSGAGGRTDNSSLPHKYLCMNWETEEFSYFEGEYNYLIPGPWHLDENSGGLVAFQREDAGNLKYGPLSGDTLEATVTTGHIGTGGKRTFVRGAEPQYQGSGATVSMSAKDRVRDAASFSAYAAEDGASGIVPFDIDGRSIATSVRFAAASDWSDLTGVVLDADEAGER